MSLFAPPASGFLQTNAWQNQNLNALRYNTSQAGSVVPLVYGKIRVAVNLLDLANYQGPQGKKGKTGPLPITGTANSPGKGDGGKGDGGKKGGKKGGGNYSVDVIFAVCQGPIAGIDTVYANAASAPFGSVPLNLYLGTDGQAPDPTFAGLGHNVGYSGTAYVSATPMDLGQSPVLPNISFEVRGILTGTSALGNGDANPAQVVLDFLTNLRYGAQFPSDLVDPDLVSGAALSYGTYCDAASFGVSIMLDGQQTAAAWILGLADLTNTEIVWSGKLLRFVPRGDTAISANGVSWYPALEAQYDLTDDDFIRWGSSSEDSDSAEPSIGEQDPIIVTRTNPADAANWFSIEYTDRSNFYNATVLPVFDQGAIDSYGLRLGNNINGKAFSSKESALVAAQLVLQRQQYVRNNPYRFQLSWKYGLLEPMDIVLVTGSAGDTYLNQQPIRITSIEESENGDLIVEGYEVNVGRHSPYVAPVPPSPPGGGGNWDCETIAHKFGTPPQTLGVLENNDQDAVLLGQSLFNQCGFASFGSNEGGKYYFEMGRFDHALPYTGNYLRVVIDLDNFLLWLRAGIIGFSGLSGSMIGIANDTFVNAQALTWPGQAGYDANSFGWGSVIGSFGNAFYYKGHTLSTPYPVVDTLTWNADPLADPSTGVGGIDITGGLGPPNPGPWKIVGQSWSIGGNSQVLRIFTSTTVEGFQNTIPAGVRGW